MISPARFNCANKWSAQTMKSKKKIFLKQVRFILLPADEETGPCSYLKEGDLGHKSYPEHQVPMNDDLNRVCVRCGRVFTAGEADSFFEYPDPQPELLAGHVRVTAGSFKDKVGYYDDDEVEDGEMMGVIYFGTLAEGYYLIPKRHLVQVDTYCPENFLDRLPPKDNGE